MGSTFCRGYSGITFNIGSDSACLIVLAAAYISNPKEVDFYKIVLTNLVRIEGTNIGKAEKDWSTSGYLDYFKRVFNSQNQLILLCRYMLK